MQQDDGSSVSFCPSFNCYSSDKLVDIAVKVSREFDGRDPEASSGQSEAQSGDGKGNVGREEDKEEDDFEFVTLRGDPDATSSDGGGLIFPVFNRELMVNPDDRDREKEQHRKVEEDVASIRIPLRNLFIDDRDPPSSSSSSEADELDGVAPGTYCVWAPKRETVESSPSRCKKSKSTGSSSKRWRFRDLLRRSNSERKDSSFVILNSPPNLIVKNSKREEKATERKSIQLESKAKRTEKTSASAHEVFYVRNKALKEGDKRKSYLPYRRDLVGLFANVNSVGRTFPPF